jgi:hypothetical protein
LTIRSVTIKDAVDEARQEITRKWGNKPDHIVENLGGCFVMVS